MSPEQKGSDCKLGYDNMGGAYCKTHRILTVYHREKLAEWCPLGRMVAL